MKIEGWASTPKLDCARDVVHLGAFSESIARKGLSGPKGIKLLAQHNHDQPIGVITNLEDRPQGLWIEAEIDERISYAKDLVAAIETNGGLSYSVGFSLRDAIFDYDEQNELFNIRKANLHEVSVVTFPCNEDCVQTVPKSLSERMEDLGSRLKSLTTTPTAAQSLARLKELNK